METQSLTEVTQSSKFSTQLALGSFVIGTLLLCIHLAVPDEEIILIIGFLYVLFAGFINGIVFLNLLFHFTLNPFQRENLAIKMLLLLSNIPIAFLYFFILTQNINSNF